jgi:hypothetical protein
MDYYDQSQKPPYSPASTGDNLSYQSTSSDATVVGVPSTGRGFWAYSKGQGGGNGTATVYTLQICVDGSPMRIDVYAAGQPY